MIPFLPMSSGQNHYRSPTGTVIQDINGLVRISLDTSKWLITQTTAFASVNLFENFRITPKTSQYVNNNGNAWSTELTKRIYKSFIGAHNYKNHVQQPDKSFGIVLDSVPRWIDVDGESVIYVDILVATNRDRDPNWARAIETGVIKYGSVGCSCSCLQCTTCGRICPGPPDHCEHMKVPHKGKYYLDTRGLRLRQANLVTDYPNHRGECFAVFTEWSYLDNTPAFAGAALSHVIALPNTGVIHFDVPKKIVMREAFEIWKPAFYNITDV